MSSFKRRKSPWFAPGDRSIIYVPATTETWYYVEMRRRIPDILGVQWRDIKSMRFVDMRYDEDEGQYVECRYDDDDSFKVWKVSLVKLNTSHK